MRIYIRFLFLIGLASTLQVQTVISDPPSWADEEIWHQIFVERFCNGDPTSEDIQDFWFDPRPENWSPTPWTRNWHTLVDDWAIENDKAFYIAVQRRHCGDLQRFIDIASLSGGYERLAAGLGPEAWISAYGATRRDTVVLYNPPRHYPGMIAFPAGANPNTNESGSMDLANRADVLRKSLVVAQQKGTGRSWQNFSDAIGGSNMRNAALAALYNATHGDSWDNNTNWAPLTSPTIEELSTWYGVTVHLGKFTELYLHDNNLRGMLPSEIGDLSDLQVLWIDGNTLEGSIPGELGQLSQLRTLLLSHNEMSGSIPDQLGSLKELETLWLHDNRFSGMIPSSLGNLTKLRSLVLSGNKLLGSIPDELGHLKQLETLWLNDNAFSGEVPQSIGDLQELQQLVLDNNDLSGSLPRSLLGLHKLEYLSFEGQPLCAPSDEAFQSWLNNIDIVRGSVCNEELHLIDRINDLSFVVNHTIVPVTFPVAMGGTAPYAYSLDPILPAGLMFDSMLRLLAGTPSVVGDPVEYTYTASDFAGVQTSQTFSIEVIGSLSAADDSVLPESFILRGNYPNPFRETTRVIIDLPVAAVVTIDVMDLTGRQVLAVPATSMPAGKGQSVLLTRSSLTSGLYLYRVQFSSREYTEVRYGRLLHMK